jgi:hypothetical protein
MYRCAPRARCEHPATGSSVGLKFRWRVELDRWYRLACVMEDEGIPGTLSLEKQGSKERGTCMVWRAI